MKQNVITQAIGALKPTPIFVNIPAIVSHATMIEASVEASQLLKSLPPVSAELAELFRCVDAVIGEGQIAYITPTKSPEYPYGAVVANQRGNVCAAAMGKSKEGFAELIRFKLLSPSEVFGEAVA